LQADQRAAAVSWGVVETAWFAFGAGDSRPLATEEGYGLFVVKRPFRSRRIGGC